MIGHTFSSSGAVALAIAPSLRVGDYTVLAKTDSPEVYAVATVAQRDLIEASLASGTGSPAEGGPHRWLHAEYLDYDGAIHYFSESTGIEVATIGGNVDQAVHLIAERTGTSA